MDEPPPFELRIALRPGTMRAGDPVLMQIDLVHNEDGVLRVEHWSEWFEFEIDARGPDGKELPRTRFGNLAFRTNDASVKDATLLAKGGTWRSEIALNRIFDMTLAGGYRIALARELRSATSGDWVRAESNVLEFELTGSLVPRDEEAVSEAPRR